MAIGSGLGASVGVAAESTYGTYVAPSKFFEVNSSQLKKVKTTVQGGGLAAGRMVQPGSRRIVATEAGSGSIELEVTNKGIGLLLSHIFGATTGPTQQAATTAYLQTHTLADNIGKMLTIQNGVPDTTGVVRPYTFKGGKVTSAEFKCSLNELLTATVEFDFQKASEVETLAAPSYLTGIVPFHFGQMSIKLGAYGAEAVAPGVKGITLKVERGQNTDRFYAAGTGLKDEPLVNDWVKVSGSVDADLKDKAAFADRFASDSSASLVIDFTGPIIASTYAQRLTFKLPMTFFDGDTPVISGPDVTTGSYPFVVQNDLTNPVASCEYVSTDSTL